MSSTLADSRLAGLVSLLETLPGGLMLLDMDGHCFYANSEACALLGVTSETLLGHELALQFPLQERLAVAAQITSSRGGDSGGWSSIVPIAGGEERAVELTLRRSTLDGKPLIAVTLCDTTEGRRLALTRVEEHRSAF